MLVLTRKVGESIRIGENIVLKVVSSSQRSVRLAIEAPREIPVHRSEVYERLAAEEAVTQAVTIAARNESVAGQTIGTFLVCVLLLLAY